MAAAQDTHRLLVVDDDPAIVRAICLLLQRHTLISGAHSIAEANALLERYSFRGLIVDVQLRDGNGIDLVAAARRNGQRVPALVISGILDESMKAQINRTSDLLDATFYCKPVTGERLHTFLLETLLGGAQFAATVDDFLEARGAASLSPTEAVTIRMSLAGIARDGIAQHRGIASGTLNKQLATAIAKLGFECWGDLVRALLRRLSSL